MPVPMQVLICMSIQQWWGSWICWSTLLKCSRNLSLDVSMTTKVSPTYLFPITWGGSVALMALISKSPMKRLDTIGLVTPWLLIVAVQRTCLETENTCCWDRNLLGWWFALLSWMFWYRVIDLVLISPYNVEGRVCLFRCKKCRDTIWRNIFP